MRKIYGIAIVGMGLIMGFWAGCTVDASVEQEGVFPCATEADCIDGYECRDGFCYTRQSILDPECIDNDQDGYGVGTPDQRRKCPLCESTGACDEDCDDTNRARSPGAGELCNGQDDNCNEEIDEPTSCEDNEDCNSINAFAPENSTALCESNVCVVKMSITLCTNGLAGTACPCNSDPVSCTDGMYEEIPDPSLCLM